MYKIPKRLKTAFNWITGYITWKPYISTVWFGSPVAVTVFWAWLGEITLSMWILIVWYILSTTVVLILCKNAVEKEIREFYYSNKLEVLGTIHEDIIKLRDQYELKSSKGLDSWVEDTSKILDQSLGRKFYSLMGRLSYLDIDHPFMAESKVRYKFLSALSDYSNPKNINIQKAREVGKDYAELYPYPQEEQE